MAIELSNVTFTEQDDIVPASGMEEIVNSAITNTLAGNDVITGTSSGNSFSFLNKSTLNTDDGNDIITGNLSVVNGSGATIDTGKGNDIITGIIGGITNFGIINTGDDEDYIISRQFFNRGGVFLEDGNDLITANLGGLSRAVENYNVIDTGDGNDIITITGVLYNQASNYPGNNGTINTGNGDDSIIVEGNTSPGNENVIYNYGGTIDTGEVTTLSLLAKALPFIGMVTKLRIYNSGGTINTGDGDDSIIVYESSLCFC
jgi:hypothetical protein